MKYMRKAFTEREAGILFAQLLLGVYHVHSKKIVHRDIKSSNVFLCASGLVKLGDFGFSKTQENTIATGGTFLGTPFYLSPEMWLGKKNGRKADIWALGVVLYEMLSNRRPFLGDDTQSLRTAVISNTREPVGPNVSRDMCLLVNSLLEPDVLVRPKCLDVLATPIMQHYVELLAAVVARDQALPAAVRETILSSIQEVQRQVEEMKQRSIDDPSDCRYEGAVLKESGNGVWKERYLALTPTELTLSLPASRVSAPGADRSRSMPVSTIDFVCPSSESSAQDRFAFEVMFDTGYTLLLATRTLREREIWIGKILTAVDTSAA
jgi:serine/threonine protein kinase